MSGDRKLLSAEDLDAMTPNQRAAAFREGIITDPNELPAHVRDKVFETGRRVASERNKGS